MEQVKKLTETIKRLGYFKTFFLSFRLLILPLFALALSLGLISGTKILRMKAAVNLTPSLLFGKKGKSPEFAKGEILVKFKPQAAKFKVKAGTQQDGLEKTAIAFSDLDPQSMPPILDGLNKKFKIDKIEKVFKETSDPKTELDKFKQKYAADIQKGTIKINEEDLLKLDFSRIYKISLTDVSSVNEAIKMLSRSSLVEYAEPNFIFKTQQIIPNDPYYLDHYPDNVGNRDPNWNPLFDYQWALKKVNMTAWGIGSSVTTPIYVGVVDTGVDYTHPELGGCTITQVNNNQCVLVAPGYDFVSRDNDPMDDMGHGTHVAGTIAALTNNGKGIAALNSNNHVKILPVKALDQDGSGYSSDLSNAVIYAVDQGARVINMSWGMGPLYIFPQIIKDAMDYGYSHGVLMVAAAGNSDEDLKNGFWPASYPKILTVSATDPNDQKAPFSNYGENIDLSAPGVDILSLRANGTDMYQDGTHIINNQYYYASGTSMAAPHVASLAALILSQRPTLTTVQVESIMKNSADKIETGGESVFSGYGRINVQKSLSSFDTAIPITAKINLPDSVNIGNRFKIPIIAEGKDFRNYVLRYRQDSLGTWTNIQGSSSPVNGIVLMDISSLANGKYQLQVAVSSSTQTKTSTKMITKDNRISDGWPIVLPNDFSAFQFKAPVVTDLNNDNKEETIFLENSIMHVFGSDGTELAGWPKSLEVFDKVKYIGAMVIPSVGEFDTNYPGKEIATVQYEYPKSATPSVGDYKLKLIVFHKDGTVMSGFPLTVSGKPTFRQGESLVIDDVNGDGKMEIIFMADAPIGNGKFITKVYTINSNGQVLPNFPVSDTLDLGHEDGVDIYRRIYTGNFSSNPGREILFYSGSIEWGVGAAFHLTILNGNGGTLPGWPKVLSSDDLWFMDDGSVSVGDVIPGNPFDEIILQENDNRSTDIVSNNGAILAQKSTGGFSIQAFNSSILGDINSDGVLDVFITDLTGTLDYYSARTISGFPKSYSDPINPGYSSFYNTSVMADLGNDQKTDILMPALFGSVDFGYTGDDFGYKSYVYSNGALNNGIISPIKSYPYIAPNDVYVRLEELLPLSLGDIDGDGKAEIITSANFIDYSVINAYKTNQILGKKYWTQFMGDEKHTGSYVSIVTPSITPTPTLTRIPTPTTTKTPTPTRRPTATLTPRPTATSTPRPAKLQGRIYYDVNGALDYRVGSEQFGPVSFRMDYYDPWQVKIIISGGNKACVDSCSPVCGINFQNGGYSTPDVKAGNGYQLRLVLNDPNWVITEAYLAKPNACNNNKIAGVTVGGLGTSLINIYNINLLPGEVKNIWFGVKPK